MPKLLFSWPAAISTVKAPRPTLRPRDIGCNKRPPRSIPLPATIFCNGRKAMARRPSFCCPTISGWQSKIFCPPKSTCCNIMPIMGSLKPSNGPSGRRHMGIHLANIIWHSITSRQPSRMCRRRTRFTGRRRRKALRPRIGNWATNIATAKRWRVILRKPLFISATPPSKAW